MMMVVLLFIISLMLYRERLKLRQELLRKQKEDSVSATVAAGANTSNTKSISNINNNSTISTTNKNNDSRSNNVSSNHDDEVMSFEPITDT
jgi:hypothetical protein